MGVAVIAATALGLFGFCYAGEVVGVFGVFILGSLLVCRKNFGFSMGYLHGLIILS